MSSDGPTGISRSNDIRLRIGVISHDFPTERYPFRGVYIRDELNHLAEYIDIRLIAPYLNRYWWFRDRGGTSALYPVRRPFAPVLPHGPWQRYTPTALAVTLARAGRGWFDDRQLVHVHNAYPDGVAAVRAFGGRLPVVVTTHGSDINHFITNPSLRPLIVKALNRSAAVIAVGTELKRTIRTLGVSAPVTVIPNGLDPDVFHPGDRNEACAVLGVPDDRPRILFVGYFTAVKGIDNLLKAMPAVLAAHPDVELVLVGARPDGDNTEPSRRLAESLGIAHVMKIVPAVPHETLARWYTASDVLVLPSHREGFGMVAAEALACGRPVVATRSGGPEDIVVDGCGALVPTRDPDALAAGIIRVLSGQGIMPAGELAASAHSRFSYDRVSRDILAVYRSVLE